MSATPPRKPIPRTSFDEPTAESANAGDSIAVSRFDEAYSVGRPAWDIDGPQPDFVRLVDARQIYGRVLDVGCGTGEHALFFAANGLEVVGIDASEVAVKCAMQRAREAQQPARSSVLDVRFIVGDAVELTTFEAQSFDTVTDSGFLHVLSDEQRERAITSIHRVLRPAGTYWLMCFNEHAVHPGPRRISQADIRGLFADGWEVTAITPARFKLLPHAFGDNASTAWLAGIKRL